MGGWGWRAAGVTVACVMTAACNSTSSGEGAGRQFINLIYYGGTTVPPSQGALASEVVCPSVTIAPGAAAINSYAGGATGSPEALRSQLSITNIARECKTRPDGSTLVKVGVEGRALIGPGGGAGRFDAPLRFTIKSNERVVASTVRRVAVNLAPGELQGSFLVVEEGLVAPPNIGDFDIEVALGGAGAERPARRARR